MSNESFFDLADQNLDDAIEPKAAPAGEYTVEIMDWRTDANKNVVQKDKNDLPYVMPVLQVVECPEAEYAKQFSHFLRIPSKDLKAKDLNAAKWNLKVFCLAFGIDYTSRFDWTDCIGLRAECILKVDADTGYGEQNAISKFIEPR